MALPQTVPAVPRDRGDLFTQFPLSRAPLPDGAALKGSSDAFVCRLSDYGNDGVGDFSTYLGGGGDDCGYGIAVYGTPPQPKVYVTGQTNSTDFPTQIPRQVSRKGASDAFVTCIRPNLTYLVYSTYLGGSGDESGHAIVVDEQGNALLTGKTTSTNFPTQNPVQSSFGGGDMDAFVTKFDAAGSLAYSTFLGGSAQELYELPNTDYRAGIAVDKIGNTYVTGWTFPWIFR